MSRGAYQRELVTDKIGHPIDLSERMLDDLSRLFARESEAMDHEACELYVRGEIRASAAAELASVGLLFDSKEIADLAFVKWKKRRGDEERNLQPWERAKRERAGGKLPWE